MTGVVTDRGEIETDVVVNAGGMFARSSARSPASKSRSCRWHTSTSSRAERPAARHADDARPSLLVYFRPESGGLVMGGYERDPAPWSLDGIPADFNGKLLEEDWPRFEPLLENAIRRVPALEEMEVGG